MEALVLLLVSFLLQEDAPAERAYADIPLGLAAPAFQSTFGTPLVFRLMQSAAKGGWGASVVNGFVTGGSLVANGAMCLLQKKVHEKEKVHTEQ